MDKILVTGASGFIGSALLKKLSKLGYQVCGISKNGGVVDGISIDAVDCTSQRDLDYYCQGKSFDGIIHLAALVPSDFYGKVARQSLLENVHMTKNLLEVLREQGCGGFIYASSSSVYGYQDKLPVTEETSTQPNGFYASGKVVGELLCQQCQRELNLPIAILRISAPYGLRMRRETVVTKFIKRAILSEVLTLYGTGNRSQDFVYIDDIVNGIVQASESRVSGIFNISTGESTSMKELAELVLRILSESKSIIEYAEIEDLQENYHGSFSFEKAKESFNYIPKFSLEMGLREIAKVMK